MADALISYLMDNLTRILSQEADLLLGVEDEVMSLQSELRLTQSYLRSYTPQQRGDHSDVMAEFIKQVGDVAREAEDIVEDYVTSVAHQRGKNLLVKAKNAIYPRLWARRRVAKEIKGIKKKFEQIYRNRDKLGLPNLTAPQGNSSLRRRRQQFVEVTDVVGFDTDARIITDRLTHGEPRRDVIPIVGMGGIGKTTLARKVYNDPVIAEHFHFRAWVYVSQGYRVRDLLQGILKSTMGLTTEEMKDMNDVELGSELQKYLRSTRYLIILDDVWKTEFWGELNQVFVDNRYGSRIILTTRHKEVARHVNSRSPPHDLHFLSKEESWELFSKKVFPGTTCPLDLEEPGKQMADKCGGLPLAIVVLAGVVLKKELTNRWWSKVSSSVSSFLINENEETDHQCKEILELSYSNLPHHLKPCFLYFGLFPKDFEISSRQLVMLWIAEGFVQKKGGETMEEVGEEYLEDLIARNLIQVSKRRFDGTVKACHIHDLLQDLAILKAKEEKFLEVLGNRCSSLSSTSRRLGLHSIMLNYLSSHSPASKLRSMLCFGLDDRQLSFKEWKLLYRGFPLLRVLDPRDVGTELIPNEIDKLVHLRYLRLKSLTAQTLPSSISNLWNLQTLEVTAPCIDRPLIDIWKMRELRHLYFRGQVVLPEPPKEEFVKDESGKVGLINLSTLSRISPVSCTQIVFSMLPNLLKLGIHGDLEEHGNLMFKNLSILNSLRTLKLEGDRCCNRLHSLGHARFPPNLTKLTLVETQLLEDTMYILGQLPNLQVLKLKNAACSGCCLNCPGPAFPKLQVLKLVNLVIKSWTISDQGSTMPSLRSVVINRCEHLKGLPPALRGMHTFRELELWSPRVSLVNEARKIEMSRGREQFMLVIY